MEVESNSLSFKGGHILMQVIPGLRFPVAYATVYKMADIKPTTHFSCLDIVINL